MAAEDSGILRCMDGPEHSPLMLRIQTGVYVDNVNKFGIEKEFSTSNGPIKNPSEADIAGARQKVFSGHDMVGGDDVGDLNGIAKNMLSASSGSKAECSRSEPSEWDSRMRGHEIGAAIHTRTCLCTY